MKLSQLLALIFVSTSLISCGKTKDNTKPIKVIVLSGQSNMEGHDAFYRDLPEDTRNEYLSGLENIKINYDCQFMGNSSNGEFVDVKFGQGIDKSHFGPEVGLAKYLATNDPDTTYYLIKSAKGSSGLDLSYGVEYTYDEGGLPYKDLISNVNKSIKYFKENKINFEISGFVWMQGETDATSPNTANKYEDNEYAFITNFKNRFKSSISSAGLTFVDGGISTTGWPKYANIVNDSKKSICSTNPKYVYCDAGETLPKINSYHYTPEGYLALGTTFGEAYLSV